MSHNLRAYEPIHGSNLFEYAAHMSRAQADEEEEDDDDNDAGNGINDGASYYQEADEESERETYRRFEQDRDGVDDEDHLYSGTDSMLRAVAGRVQGYTAEEDEEET